MEFGSLAAHFEDSDADLLLGLVQELNALNLLRVRDIPSIKEPDYANYPLDFTSLGLRFVDAVLADSADWDSVVD